MQRSAAIRVHGSTFPPRKYIATVSSWQRESFLNLIGNNNDIVVPVISSAFTHRWLKTVNLIQKPFNTDHVFEKLKINERCMLTARRKTMGIEETGIRSLLFTVGERSVCSQLIPCTHVILARAVDTVHLFGCDRQQIYLQVSCSVRIVYHLHFISFFIRLKPV